MTSRSPVCVVAALLVSGALAPSAAAQGLQLEHVSDNPATNPDPNLEVAVPSGTGDGTSSFWTTAERMTADDTDNSFDIYARVGGGAIRLVSDGPGATDPAIDAFFASASFNADHIFFSSQQSLAASDTDTAQDVYARKADGSLQHISDHPTTSPDAAKAADFTGGSADGTRATFLTSESMLSSDTDSTSDIYAREPNGGLTLVSGGPATPDPEIGVDPGRVSRDGSRVFWETHESISTFGDTDSVVDVYARNSNGSVSLISDHPTSNPDAETGARVGGASADGARVFFVTDEPLLASDTDASQDVYARNANSTLSHLSDHPTTSADAAVEALFGGSSHDGTRVFIATSEAMVASDTDPALDVYERRPDSGLTLLSDHPATTVDQNQEASFGGASGDGSRVVFTTFESLLSSDTDGVRDVYARNSDGTLTHLSDHVTGAVDQGLSASLRGVSDDGTAVFFSTTESMLPSDTDNVADLYRVSPQPAASGTPAAGGTGVEAGGGAPAGESAQPLDVAPVVGQLTMASRFRAAGSGGAIAAASRVGTTVRYALSEPATANFTVERPVAGRRVGRTCAKPTKRNRRGRRCTRYVRVGRPFTHRGAAGANAFKFTGRPGSKLRPGKYRLALVAADAAGNKSQPKLRPFTIVAR